MQHYVPHGFRNFENTPATRICDPVKNETITLWLEETKRKNEAGGEEVVAKMRDSGKILTLAKIFVRHPTVENSDATGGCYFLPWVIS